MPVKEAIFYVGITIFGAGLYFMLEGVSKRMFWPSVIVTAVGASAIAYAVYAHYNPDAFKVPIWVYLLTVTWIFLAFAVHDTRVSSPAYPKQLAKINQTIYGKTFRNETVELDGKSFDHCTFENVTLVYHGTGLWDFKESTFGPSLLRTDNASIKAFNQLLEFYRKTGRQMSDMHFVDENGNVIPIPPPVSNSTPSSEVPGKTK
jgi:hypothetical protein